MNLEPYTEQAMALLGGTLPKIVYLPPSLRTRPMPENTSAVNLSDAQLDRIVAADPLGFLVAILHGAPVVGFSVKSSDEERPPTAKRPRGRPRKVTTTARVKIDEVDGLVLYAEYHSPTVADRERVAMFLTEKLIARKGASAKEEPPDEWDQLVKKRAAEATAAGL